jgi:hypothetical protein
MWAGSSAWQRNQAANAAVCLLDVSEATQRERLRRVARELSPRHVRHGRHGVEVAQLDGLDIGSQLAGDRLPHRCLACPAGAGDQE